MKTYGTSRGCRNHNPCNVRCLPPPQTWRGQVGVDNNPGGPFAIYGDAPDDAGVMQEADHWGIRTCARNFESYQRLDGCDTIGKVIQRHAPPSDNNDTQAYINAVCGRIEVEADEVVDLINDPVLMLHLISEVIVEEEGSNPYSDIFIANAIMAAKS